MRNPDYLNTPHYLTWLTDTRFYRGAFSFLAFACTLSLAIPLAQSYPTKTVRLSDWNLKQASQIGYLSIGLLHKREGDQIIIYDIREDKPTLKNPAGPQGRVPDFDGDYFLVSHFNQGNVNRLGGYFNGFSRLPSKSSVAITQGTDGISALTFNFINQPPGFSGFWIHFFDFKSPPSERVFLDSSPFTHMTFSFRGETGNEAVMLRMADRAMEKKEDSYLIGEVASFLPEGQVNKDWKTAWVPLSRLNPKINKKELANVVFQIAGNNSGRVFVKDLAFSTKKDVAIAKAQTGPAPPCTSDKAMWLWETDKIIDSAEEQNTFFDFLKTQHITDVFAQIPYEAEKTGNDWTIAWESDKMRPLLSRLNRAGVRVHALDGDPRYALREWHGRTLGLLQKIIDYNTAVTPQERFYGIRYDNEPYLLPQFGGVNQEKVLMEYLELAEKSQALARSGGLVFGVDIPFWFDAYNEFFEPAAAFEGRLMSERIIDIVDNVGIMDYRTIAYGADGVIEHGSKELQYAADKGKKVYIGLETVWLPDETIYDFGPKGSGYRVLIQPLDAHQIQISVIPKGETVDSRGALVLHETRRVPVPSSKLTFEPKSPEDLEEVMRHSEQELCKYPSFHGFVIHSYESYRPWLEKQKPSMRVNQ